MEMKLIKKSITGGSVEAFNFDVNGYEFLVKNLNDTTIYVAFKNTSTTDDMIEIPANCCQICVINKSLNEPNCSKSIYVYSASNVEVEVQCIRY